jgi:hypothetical protein
LVKHGKGDEATFKIDPGFLVIEKVPPSVRDEVRRRVESGTLNSDDFTVVNGFLQLSDQYKSLGSLPKVGVSSTPGQFALFDDVRPAFIQHIQTVIGTLLQDWDDASLQAIVAMDENVLAERILAALPSSNVWDAELGPFYEGSALAKWKGIARPSVYKAVKERRAVGLKTSDGDILFPSFQFDATGQYLPELRKVLDLLDPNNQDPWGDALWLRTPFDTADGPTPAALLRSGDTERVLAEASHAGSVWGS